MAELLLIPVGTGTAQPAVSVEGPGQTADGCQFNQLLNQMMDKPEKFRQMKSSSSSQSMKSPSGKTAEMSEQVGSDAAPASEGEALSSEADGKSTAKSGLDEMQENLASWYHVYLPGLPAESMGKETLALDAVEETMSIEGLSGTGQGIILADGAGISLLGNNLNGLVGNPVPTDLRKTAVDNGVGEIQVAETFSTAQSEQMPEIELNAVKASMASIEKPAFGVTVHPLQVVNFRNPLGQGVSSVPITVEPDTTFKHQLSVAPLLQQQPEHEAEVTSGPENMEDIHFSDIAAASELKLAIEAETEIAFAETSGKEPEMTMNAGLDTVLAHKTQQQPVAGGEIPNQTETSPVSRENVFEQIVEKARIMAGNGHSEMELDLKPDHLGKIQLRISLENNLISARFIAESEQVKAILETNLADLKRQLQENGVNVQQLLVSTGNESRDPALNQNAFSDHQQNQSQSNGKWAMISDEAEFSEDPVRQGTESVIDLIA
ncbi:MAG TPA: flagellar hook-length control protein FliK [Bacillota bacterium]|nr:flagellar hook-length control protein FliK [Bacillota bacterium]